MIPIGTAVPPRFFPVPAAVLIGLWFLIQVEGVSDLVTASSGGGVAYWAHIGGFIVGLGFMPFIQRPERTYRAYYADEGILGFNTQGLR